jgi:hypothetical protein
VGSCQVIDEGEDVPVVIVRWWRRLEVESGFDSLVSDHACVDLTGLELRTRCAQHFVGVRWKHEESELSNALNCGAWRGHGQSHFKQSYL